ncbi:MAG: hypothetical protein RLZZ546_2033, partial [Bacteroidota bacterium]
MKQFFLVTYILLSPSYIFLQNGDNKWVFGYFSEDNWSTYDSLKYPWFFNFQKTNSSYGTSLLDFSQDPPSFSYEREMTLDRFDANTSLCDSDNNILLYSNGMQTHNNKHEVLLDSMGFGDYYRRFSEFKNYKWYPKGTTVPQSVIILPFYNNQEVYIIYSKMNVDLKNFIPEVFYSKVTKNEKNEYQIERKNISIDKRSFHGGMTACRHANGRDWWLAANELPNKLLIYLVEPRGISLKNELIMEGDSLLIAAGGMKFSPNGKKLALQSGTGKENHHTLLYVFDFDRIDGSVKQMHFEKLNLAGQGDPGGLEISYDSKKLYISKSN